MSRRQRTAAWCVVFASGLFAAAFTCLASFRGAAKDAVRALQDGYIATKSDKVPRFYHFGSQGPGEVFSNHTSHTNRLVPVYVFGTKARLFDFTGTNSCYRDASKIEALYGRLPEHTLNPEAEYADQSDLYRLQSQAVARGVKHLFLIWFDGLDWETTRAAAVLKTGRVYQEGMGSGLIFQDYDKAGPIQFGYVVTAPTHDDPPEKQIDVDRQVVGDLSEILGGGYDPRFAGPNPWTPGPLLGRARGYLKGQSMTKAELSAVAEAGGLAHAYTDSAPSAAEAITGVKMFNGSINMRDDGTWVPTLFNQLQEQGWKVGTVTSVPFSHASPAAMYAHNVSRDDYQDLSREMLGLPYVGEQCCNAPARPGLDVVMGAGWGVFGTPSGLARQGRNAVAGNAYLTAEDLRAIDVRHGGRYVVTRRTAGTIGRESLQSAAEQAARDGKRLFGMFGTGAGHLPYRTADGDYVPAKGILGVAERYSPEDLRENPTLADMTHAALTVLAADPTKPFALFVEAGDVDFGLHDNNLDTAIGAIYSGEEAVRVVTDWVEAHSNWDESLMVVTSDHGHYLVVDDIEAFAKLMRGDGKKD